MSTINEAVAERKTKAGWEVAEPDYVLSDRVDATNWSTERLVRELQEAIDYSRSPEAVFYTVEESRALLHGKGRRWTDTQSKS